MEKIDKQTQQAYDMLGEKLGIKLPPLGEATSSEIMALSVKSRQLSQQAGLYGAAFNMLVDERAKQPEAPGC